MYNSLQFLSPRQTVGVRTTSEGVYGNPRNPPKTAPDIPSNSYISCKPRKKLTPKYAWI